MNNEPLTELPQQKKRSGKFSAFVGRTVLIGAGLLLIALAVINFRGLQIDKDWKHVNGTVVDVKTNEFDKFEDEDKDGRSDKDLSYAPIVEYSVEGKKYRVTSGNGTGAPVKVGSTREVAYDPSRPSEAKIVADIQLNIGILAYIPVGLLWLFIAIFPQKARSIDKRFRAFRRNPANSQMTETPSDPPALPAEPPGAPQPTSVPQPTPPDRPKNIYPQ